MRNQHARKENMLDEEKLNFSTNWKPAITFFVQLATAIIFSFISFIS